MRLTSVAQMALPPGKLLSYAVSGVPEPGPELVVSFDQGRHVGLGQRPASWMAVAARLDQPVAVEEIGRAWHAVIERHGALRTGFTRLPDGELRLHQLAISAGVWQHHEVPPGGDQRQLLRELFDRCCAPFEQPAHRLAVVLPDQDQPDQRPMVIIGSDHAHVDMWSFLVILRDLATSLADLRGGGQAGASLPVAASFAEHSAALAQRPAAPAQIQRRWAEVLAANGGVMPIFPLPLGDQSEDAETVGEGDHSVVEVRDLLDAAAAERFEAVARSQGVRMLALAVSVMTAATAELAGVGLRAVLPVHSRDEERWRDSVGWYITNSVLESAEVDPAACAQAVAEAIKLGSYPLGPILAPYGGMPVAPGLFAISWLDTRRGVPALAAAAHVQYVSAMVRDDGVMVWFIVNASGLHLRARYPDRRLARENVGAWLDRVEAGLRAATA